VAAVLEWLIALDGVLARLDFESNVAQMFYPDFHKYLL